MPSTVSLNSGPHHAGETVRPPLVTTTFPELDPVEVGQILGARAGEGRSRTPPFGAGRRGGLRGPSFQADRGQRSTARNEGGQQHPGATRMARSTARNGWRALHPYPPGDPWLVQPPEMILAGQSPGAFDPWPVQPPEMSGGPHPGAFDPWPVGPPEMSGGPHPGAFDPWLAPPGPGSQVAYAETIRTPVMSAGAQPGWQGAETHGFARAASGAVELPFSRREAIVRRFESDDALRHAEFTLQSDGADALRWSAMQQSEVLYDLYRLNAMAQLDPAGAAEMVDIDWRAIESLGFILECPPSFTVTQPSAFRWRSCRHDERGPRPAHVPTIR